MWRKRRHIGKPCGQPRKNWWSSCRHSLKSEMYASQRPDFFSQKHNWPSLAKQARSAVNQSSQDGKTADESASMTVEENSATKTELERLDLLEILSMKEAIFVEDHTPALPIGAPGEFQHLRSRGGGRLLLTPFRDTSKMNHSLLSHSALLPHKARSLR